MSKRKLNNVERLGVNCTERAFLKLYWIFREQSIEDFGIDAFVEICEEGNPTGQLLALQIKSGSSYFKENKGQYVVFRGEKQHLEYWKNHDLPVLLILCDVDQECSYWQAVNEYTVEHTSKGWKVNVPFDQVINESALNTFRKISKKISAFEQYIIFSLKDISLNRAKRYRADILLTQEYSKYEIENIARKIVEELKYRQYYRDSITEERWLGQETDVIWLFIYPSLSDVDRVNWICRVQWIDPDILQQNPALKISGEKFGEHSIIDWNNDYRYRAEFFESLRLNKEDFMKEILTLFRDVTNYIKQFEEIYYQYLEGSMSDFKFKDLASPIANLMDEVNEYVLDFGIAPVECKDLSQSFQNLIAMAHNVILPFSKFSRSNGEVSNRDTVIKMYIGYFHEEFNKFNFELNKVR
ncbi:MAG: DUF4365 domain-containing protein [Cyanobacteria bacterium P01_G01_bin.54]